MYRTSITMVISTFLAFFIFLTISAAEETRPCTKPDTTELTWYSDGVGLDKIYDALVTCPNISGLDLDFTTNGCTMTLDPWAFNFRAGDRFPALKKLSL